MKTMLKILILVLFPLMGFSQYRSNDTIRFTDKFKPRFTVELESDTFPSDFSRRKLIQYPFVREADVMWSKVTWELIDLREKMNLPLYYPLDTIYGRKSLIQAITEGVQKLKFDAFKPTTSSFEFNLDFDKVFPYDSIRECQNDTIPMLNNTLIQRWRASEITQIMIKEVWYFDRKTSQLNNEIIGLGLIREYRKILGPPTEQGFPMDSIPRRTYLFWVYYPAARDFLATIPVYNPVNNSELYSFDDLFVNRRFKSYFVREANVYNDRYITDYVTNREAQLESERIKKEIFDYEQDLWEN